MKKRYFIGLLFGAVLLTGCSGISSTIADMQMKSAKKSMESENYDKAIKKLKRAVAIQKKNVDAYIMLADAYVKAGEQKEAEDTIDKLRDLDDVRLSGKQEEKVCLLDSKRIYSDILNNFYKTGIIGDDDELYFYSDVNEIDSLDSDKVLNYYYFKLADITGDGQDEIIIEEKDKDGSSEYITPFKLIKGKAARISFFSAPVIFADNGNAVENYNSSDADNLIVSEYNSSIVRYMHLDKDSQSKEIEETKQLIADNKVILSSDDIVNRVNPDRIKEAVDAMEIPDINDIDVEEDNKSKNSGNKNSKNEDYKELYRKRLTDTIDSADKNKYWFKLADITGDNRDELIIKNLYDDSNYYVDIYSVVDGKLCFYAYDSGELFRVFDDNSILFGIEYSYNTKQFKYYKYNRDISRFYLEKAGGNRDGDLDYLNKLLEKKAKLTLDDINTELTYENIDTALGK
ncbi:tetratricopeptide repeat protein [Lachnoanaerobaculum saburreum]|uniref:Tetratricopeptide repeat protein n=1 Tax=Lachnoanaerobaculum saburreum TaxID=467210 RepID=A0A133ZHD8_9FIRM|nr:tetratricopeptide repeat protein [Lachnoanaerobaculum saburreum]KXB54864.1 tetratricopeptide repeat protein [Lachnoanaerobaculum saburreum]